MINENEVVLLGGNVNDKTDYLSYGKTCNVLFFPDCTVFMFRGGARSLSSITKCTKEDYMTARYIATVGHISEFRDRDRYYDEIMTNGIETIQLLLKLKLIPSDAGNLNNEGIDSCVSLNNFGSYGKTDIHFCAKRILHLYYNISETCIWQKGLIPILQNLDSNIIDILQYFANIDIEKLGSKIDSYEPEYYDMLQYTHGIVLLGGIIEDVNTETFDDIYIILFPDLTSFAFVCDHTSNYIPSLIKNDIVNDFNKKKALYKSAKEIAEMASVNLYESDKAKLISAGKKTLQLFNDLNIINEYKRYKYSQFGSYSMSYIKVMINKLLDSNIINSNIRIMLNEINNFPYVKTDNVYYEYLENQTIG